MRVILNYLYTLKSISLAWKHATHGHFNKGYEPNP